jgi:hypothetical protein
MSLFHFQFFVVTIECFQEYVNLAFPLSDDPGSSTTSPFPPFSAPPTTTVSPLTHLTHVLSGLPNLRTFATHLPGAWSKQILCVSRNPALKRIAIEDFTPPPIAHPGNGYENANDYGTDWKGRQFFNEAKKHPRLYKLIQAGSGLGRLFFALLHVSTPLLPPPFTAPHRRKTTPRLFLHHHHHHPFQLVLQRVTFSHAEELSPIHGVTITTTTILTGHGSVPRARRRRRW